MAEPRGLEAITTACPLLPQIKAAIKCLKERKKRPSFDRILQRLVLHQHVDNRRTVQSQLETAVQRELLFVVHSPGLPCYKDPDGLKSIRTYVVKNVKNFRRAVVMSVKEIGDPEGATADFIVQYIHGTFEVEFATLPEKLQPVLTELVRKKCLVEQAPGRYKYPGYNKSTATVLQRRRLIIDPVTKMAKSPKRAPVAQPRVDSNSTNNRAKRQRRRPKRWSSSSSSETDTTETVPREYKRCRLGKSTRTGTAPTAIIPSNAETKRSRVTRSQMSKLTPRDYECGACNFNTRTKADFLLHIESPAHREKVNGKMVQCDMCPFGSRKVEKMTEHLQRHGCHAGRSVPSCLLASSAVKLAGSK